MTLGEATVTIQLSVVNQLQADLHTAQKRTAELEEAIADAKLGGDDAVGRQYREAFLEAMHIVRFAVGNLEPLTVRGWPYKSLYQIVEHLRTLPGVDGDQRETAGDIKLFAQDCERWEQARAEGREKAMLAEENAARGPIVPTQ